MFKVLILLLAAAAVIDARISFRKNIGYRAIHIPVSPIGLEANPKPKVVGGQVAEDGQFPYFVSLQYKEVRAHFCGAAILSHHYLLSSGICVFAEKASDLIAVTGSADLTGGISYDIESYVIHPDFDFFQIYNDVSVIKLQGRDGIIYWAGHSGPIQLPVDVALLPAEVVTAMGGGDIEKKSTKDYPGQLYYLESRVMFNEDCIEIVGEPVNDNELCIDTGLGQGLCGGDAGGPLEYITSDNQVFIVGIQSFGWGCADGYPTGFARVTSFLPWIVNQTIPYFP